MQKLSEELKNTPSCASQATCSVSSELNRDESLSVQNKVLPDNNHGGNQRQHTDGFKSKVYVLNKNGNPLMPCSPCKARHLLEANKARVVRRTPFTIQLNWDCENNIHKINLGIDSGAKFIGFSAVSEKQELISGTIILDTMMKSRLDSRRMYRKNRRSRKWYRKLRFLNRVSSKKEDWLPPSIKRRYQAHLTIIDKIKKFLPVTNVKIEVGNFDIQKIKNPDIQGKEYQEDSRFGYENIKTYIMSREKHNCQLCGKSVFGKKVNLHHILPKRSGGTDKADNLALLHESCHKKLHKQKLEKFLKKSKQYKEATFMNIIKRRFKQDINCFLTFGYKTFYKRKKLDLIKSHVNDAFVIAGGKKQIRCNEFEITQKRKNNRCLQKNRKGFAPSIRRQRYSIRPLDLVKIAGKWLETKGVHCKGKRLLINKKSIAVKYIENIVHTGTFNWKQAVSLLVKVDSRFT